MAENVAISTGELIDAEAQPNQGRNQFDIVVYKKNYPKLEFGGGISAFLIESVAATIEVKSTLTSVELEKAIEAAHRAKSLNPNFVSAFSSGHVPPRVLNFVVAYDGPANMSTVKGWIDTAHQNLGINVPSLPVDQGDRTATPSPSIDGVFVLKKGFIYFDNVPQSFTNPLRSTMSASKWVVGDTQTGNLLLLFVFLNNATSNVEGRWLNATPYLSTFHVPNISFDP